LAPQARHGASFFVARCAPRLAQLTELDELLEDIARPNIDPLPALGGDLSGLLAQLVGCQGVQQGGVEQVGLPVVVAEQIAPQRAARLLVSLERDVAHNRIGVGLDFALRQQLAQVVGSAVPRRHAGPDLLLSRMVVARGQHHQAIQPDLPLAKLRHQARLHRGELNAALHHQRRDADPQQAFPGKGVMKSEAAEIERLKKENAKLRMERDILKKAAAFFAKESM